MKQVFTPGKNDFIDDIEQAKLSGATQQAANQMAMLVEFSSRLELIRKLSTESGGVIKVPQALLSLARDVNAQFATRGDPSVPYGITAQQYEILKTKFEQYSIPLPSNVNVSPNEYALLLEQYKTAREKADLMTPASAQTSVSDRVQRRGEDFRQLETIVRSISQWNEPSGAASASNGGVAAVEKKANLFSGSGYVDVSDAKLLLLRLMLRTGPGGLSESVLKAWDAM